MNSMWPTFSEAGQERNSSYGLLSDPRPGPGQNAKIPVYPLGDSGEVFYEMALEMVNTIKKHNARGKNRLHLPCGPCGPVSHFCPAGEPGPV